MLQSGLGGQTAARTISRLHADLGSGLLACPKTDGHHVDVRMQHDKCTKDASAESREWNMCKLLTALDFALGQPVRLCATNGNDSEKCPSRKSTNCHQQQGHQTPPTIRAKDFTGAWRKYLYAQIGS